MRKSVLWSFLLVLTIVALVFGACSSGNTSTTSMTSTSALPQSTTTSKPVTSATTTAAQTSTVPAPTGTAAASHWWDKFGTPQYGGTLTFRASFIDFFPDPTQDPRPTQLGAHMEQLFCDNLLTDRAEFPFQASFVPVQYKQGWMADSWKQIDPLTVNVTLKQGITWQDKYPVNGREFTADDVRIYMAPHTG